MIVPSCALLLCLASPPQGTDLQALLARGQVSEALTAASSLPTPLGRARWRVRTLHVAGWLDLALAEAKDGLSAFPDDPNLLDQAGWIAASTGDPSLTRALADRMALVRPGPAGWPEKVSRQAAEAMLLAERDEATGRALLRARVLVASVLALICLAWARAGLS